MTQITREEVIHLAELSKLQLTDDEINNLRTDLENILAYVEQLNELDTSDVEPTYMVVDRENVWREDAPVFGGVGRDELLELAPDTNDNQVKVPKVL